MSKRYKSAELGADFIGITAFVFMLKAFSSYNVAVRGPMRPSAKSKRRRGRHANFSKKRKKKNGKTAPQLAKPATIQFSSKRFIRPDWKSIVTTLGILSLFGAGSLNRSGELIWPDNVFHFDKAERVLSSAPQFDLKENRDWRADGLRHNFLADGAFEQPAFKHKAKNFSPMHAEEFVGKVANNQETFIEARQPESPRLRQEIFSPHLISREPRLQSRALVMRPTFVSSARPAGLRWQRLALIEAGSVGLGIYGFRKFDEFFGGAQKSFRAGSDWTRDHTLHFDELIHFQGGYRIAQGLIEMYRWAGLNETWSEGLGAGTAASVMTFLEYIDGRRPTKQGASYSDFTANLLGVGFALARLRVNALQDVDLRLNYTSFGDVLHKKTLLKYDRMTHWLTYDLQRQWRVPLHVGVGYGVQNAFKKNVRSEYYLGIGFTPVDILERYYPAAAKPLAWLNMYHVGWQVQIK
jgi:hypothetical protein